jgi:hypothetical protein
VGASPTAESDRSEVNTRTISESTLASGRFGGVRAASATSRQRFEGAQVVAAVFKVAACLALIVGVVSAIAIGEHLHQDHATGGVVLEAVVYVLIGSIIGASMFGFFAYVLDLLRASVLGPE